MTAEPLARNDAAYTPSDAPNALDRVALRWVKDPRDLPFFHLILQIALVQLPFALVLLAVESFPWWLGALYIAVMALGFLDRYILMLHNTSHRRLFKVAWMNHIIPWVLGPFMGQTPGTYYAHHIGMHHPENNLEEDLSSTMRFERDNALHFLAYFGRFFFFGIFELSRYHWRKRRFGLMRMALIGELAWVAMIVALFFVRPDATLWVFVVPFVAVRFLMMMGNWGQHAFIDAARPENPYVNSLTCINARYNRRCFNDGYHIGHHVKANRHWTDMPRDFNDNRARYAAEGAIVFEGIDFFIVSLHLLLRRYDYLARKMVDLGDTPMSHADKVALLRERTRPIRRDLAAA